MTTLLKLAKSSLTPPIAAIMLTLVAFNAFAVDVYVATKNTGGAEPYDTPETAIVGLLPAQAYADALIAAGSADKVRLLLAEGTYKITDELRLTNAIEVVGLGSDWDKVILQADHTGRGNTGTDAKRRVASLSNAQALICNVKFYNGDVRNETYGGGVAIIGDGGMVTNCHITGNSATGSHKNGGGAWINSDAALITHCLIDNNKGGGNGYKGNGGGVFALKGTVANCLIKNNSALKGGGVALGGVTSAGNLSSTARIVNCTIVGNSVTYSSNTSDSGNGGGVYFYHGAPLVQNCVIAENTATQTGGAGYPEWFGQNSAADVFVHCGIAASGVDTPALPDSSKENPTCFRFTPSWSEGYHVAASSPLVNAGEYCEGSGTTDLDGNPRVKGTIDVGCYECQDAGFSVDPVAAPTTLLGSGDVTFTALTANEPAGEIDFVWTLTAPRLAEPMVFHGRSVTMNLDVPGHYDVTLAATGAEPVTKGDYIHVGALTNYLVVATNGNAATVPFDSWATAATNVEEVLDEAVAGATILIGPGKHYTRKQPEIVGLKLIGVEGAERTVIANGAGNVRVMTLNDPNSLLKGVTCMNGKAAGGSYGGGILIENNGGTVEDCVVSNNTLNGGSSAFGAGIACCSAAGVVRRTIVRDNADNTSHGGSAGGGVYITGGLLEDCLIVSNKAIGAAGIRVAGGRVANCTVVGNAVPKEQKSYQDYEPQCAGGIYLSGGYVTNTIIVGNTTALNYGTRPCAPEIAVAGDKYLARFVNCGVLAPAAAPNESCVAAAEDKIGFVDAANGNWRLTASWESAFYKKGAYDAWMDGATDLDGRPRAHNRTSSGTKKVVDIGCYESDWLPPGMILLVK